MYSKKSNKVKSMSSSAPSSSKSCRCASLQLVKPNAPERKMQDVLSELSINFREIMRSPSCFWIIFWTVAFVFLMGSCIFQLHSLLVTHLSYSTYTSFDVQHVTKIRYPVTTLCTEGWMKTDSWNTSLATYHPEAQPHIRNHFRMSMEGVFAETFQRDLDRFKKIYPDDVFDMEMFWTVNHVDVEDVLVGCSLGNYGLPGSACITKFYKYTFYHASMTCFVLDFGEEQQQKIYGTPGSAYVILKNVQVPESEPHCNLDDFFPQKECEWKIFFSDQESNISLNPSSYTNVKDGQIVYIGLEKRSSLLLKPPHGTCDELHLQYFAHYTRQACAQETTYNLTLARANCSLFGIVLADKSNETPTCSMEGIMLSTSLIHDQPGLDKCPIECQYSYYDVSVASTGAVPSFLLNKLNLSKVTTMAIYHKQLWKIYSEQKPSLSFADLMSKIGATLSLWLGFKIMTFLQFFYYCAWELKRRFR